MKLAVFLDRDGVINYPVFNLKTNEYEAPFNEEDFKFLPNVIEALKKLIKLNFLLFLVSNQPDYAKGKTTLENLLSVHKRMHSIFEANSINFTEYFYCYHHPQGIVKDYSIKCTCRKPGNHFLNQAKLKYSLNMSDSWMIGDRDVDVFCGQSMGTKTIMIKQISPDKKAGQSKPDFIVTNLQEAVEVIKEETSYAKS